ncbi:hypothetical protein OB955_02025 [Halobacteria archaeon AArc-m2/3/4]|uniref:Uncharacterized protein n=1 Tax=Natronoglomus mannanivorans TaxID=2979990 RepID=A0ABT2Q9C1_9EURY|nr:hypothetical protein [Halobacteria archaeon AArc-m2/3/4]
MGVKHTQLWVAVRNYSERLSQVVQSLEAGVVEAKRVSIYGGP